MGSTDPAWRNRVPWKCTWQTSSYRSVIDDGSHLPSLESLCHVWAHASMGSSQLGTRKLPSRNIGKLFLQTQTLLWLTGLRAVVTDAEPSLDNDRQDHGLHSDQTAPRLTQTPLGICIFFWKSWIHIRTCGNTHTHTHTRIMIRRYLLCVLISVLN